MKRTLSAIMMFAWAALGLGQSQAGSTFRTSSYYGFSGLMFIPTAQVQPAMHGNIGYLSKPGPGESLDLIPFSIQIGFNPLKAGVEFALSTTAIYASKKDLGGVEIVNGNPSLSKEIPLFPSFKYQFMPMVRENHQVAMAIGFAFPYGAYYVVDKFFNVRFCDLTVHTGVATKLTTYHAFAGATLTFGERIGEIARDFPFEILLEGGWGGSLKQLNEKEEAFFAVSFRQAWTSSLYIKTFLRIDNQPLVENKTILRAGPTKRMGIGLDYSLSVD